MSTNFDDDTIEKDVNNEEDDLNEERLIGPQDEDDDDPSDTTPAEAEGLADEGEIMMGEERKRRKHPDEL